MLNVEIIDESITPIIIDIGFNNHEVLIYVSYIYYGIFH